MTYTDAQIEAMASLLGNFVGQGGTSAAAMLRSLLTERQAGSSGDVKEAMVQVVASVVSNLGEHMEGYGHDPALVAYVTEQLDALCNAIQPPQPPIKESVRGVSDATDTCQCGVPCRKEVLMRGGDNGWGDDKSRTVLRYVFANRGDGDE